MADPADTVAEVTFTFVAANGIATDVTTAIGRPFRNQEGDWACSAQMRGFPPFPAMVGEDSLQALSLALSLVRMQCEAFLQQGGRILFPETGENVPLQAYFPTAQTG